MIDRNTLYPVAALYIDPKGIYPELASSTWPEERDATRYEGPFPVVAHPPCGPWGRLRHLCTRQRRDLAIIAVGQVQRWGGVLEHPSGSRLWEECDLPRPGEPADRFGGRSFLIAQGAFGFPSPKWTWLYAVRLPDPEFPVQVGGQLGRVATMGKRARYQTPRPLADFLCRWAARCSSGPVFKPEGRS